jgi:hypothetical protein
VVYNVSETNELGASAISGILSFATGANTKLTFGNVDLTINNGGELRVGTTGAVIGASYKAEIYWNTTSDNSKGIKINHGGKMNVGGDPAYYGSSFKTTLAVNWTSGSSFTTNEDMSGKWVTGQVLTIHKNALCSNWLTDVFPATIASVSGTTVTINESFPGGTFNSGGLVLNLSRNVILGKLIADAEPIPINNSGNLKSYTNRPVILDSNSSTGAMASTFADALFLSFYRYFTLWQPTFTRCVHRYSYTCFTQNKLPNVTDDIIEATTFSFNANYGGKFDGYVLCSYYATFGNIASTIKGKFFSNNLFSSGNGYAVNLEDVEVFSNTYAFYSTSGNSGNGYFYWNYAVASGIILDVALLDAVIGYDRSATSRNNSSLAIFNFGLTSKLINCKINSASLGGRNTIPYVGRLIVADYNQVANDDRILDVYGDLYRLTADGSGSLPAERNVLNDQILQVTTQTNVSPSFPLLLIDPNKFQPYCPAGVTKRWRVYFQGDLSGTIASGNRAAGTSGITLEASYLDGTTSASRSIVRSTQTIANRTGQDDWSQYLEVECTPAVSGYVYLAVYLMAHLGSGKYLYCDPLAEEIAAEPLKYVVAFKLGEANLIQLDTSQAEIVADKVWEKLISGSVPAGSYGEKVGALKSAYAWIRTA